MIACHAVIGTFGSVGRDRTFRPSVVAGRREELTFASGPLGVAVRGSGMARRTGDSVAQTNRTAHPVGGSQSLGPQRCPWEQSRP